MRGNGFMGSLATLALLVAIGAGCKNSGNVKVEKRSAPPPSTTTGPAPESSGGAGGAGERDMSATFEGKISRIDHDGNLIAVKDEGGRERWFQLERATLEDSKGNRFDRKSLMAGQRVRIEHGRARMETGEEDRETYEASRVTILDEGH